MDTNNYTYKKGFNQEAMRCGTLLCVLWIAMYASCIIGFSIPMFSLLFLLFYVASPFYAGYLATRYRKRECDNVMPFFQAWTFIAIMYICASLLSAVIQFIYFRFIDNGYLMQVVLQTTEVVKENPDIFGTLSVDLDTAVKEFQSLGIRDIVFSILSSNIMNACLLSPIIALFVKRNPENR